jgi:LysM repeat protein
MGKVPWINAGIRYNVGLEETMSGPTAGILLLAALLLPALGAFAGRLAGRRWGPRAASSLTLLGFGGSLGLAALLLVSGAELPSAGGWAVLLPRGGPVIHALAFGAGNDQAEPQAAEAAVAAVPLVVPGADAVVVELPTPAPASSTPAPLLPTPEPVTPTPGTDLSPTPTMLPVATPAVPAFYVVQAGDTLRSIAARLRVTVEALLAANGLTEAEGDRLGVGQELRIPVETAAGGAAPAVPATAVPTSPAPSPAEPLAPTPTGSPPTRVPPRREPPSSEVRAYFVQPGDTLRSIAEQFGMGVDALLRFNGLSPAEGDQLQLGQQLYIPARE